MNLPKLKREKMVLPEPDKDGWSKFVLRDFLRIYGMYWSLSPNSFEGGMLRFHFDR